jgi:pumilio RNA-binding family
MSQHKYASNVVEKCLEHGDTLERELLIEEIIGQSEDNDNLLVPFCLVYFILFFKGK